MPISPTPPPFNKISASTAYNVSDARSLWNMIAVTQCVKEKIAPQLDLTPLFSIGPNLPIKMDIVSPFGQTGTNNQGLIACLMGAATDNKNVLVIGFRGTQPLSLINWIYNADIRTVEKGRVTSSDGTESARVKFHMGVQAEFVSLIHTTFGNSEDTIKKVAQACGARGPFHMRVIGHSKGGGLAQIFLHRVLDPIYDNMREFKAKIETLALQGFESMQVVKTESVQKYQQDLKTWFGKNVEVPIHLVTSECDLVPNLPGSILGYGDLGTRHPADPGTPPATDQTRIPGLNLAAKEALHRIDCHCNTLGQNMGAHQDIVWPAWQNAWQNKQWWKNCNATAGTATAENPLKAF